ncbi:MAG: UbiE/COQ5 family methyltransferase [Acidimicrobiales bacterium]|nr:UbiE/COQ5 family methyltransferase [Acidimicrobiales bacterium]
MLRGRAMGERYPAAMDLPEIDGREFWDRRAEAWDRRSDALEGFSDMYGAPVMDALDPQPGQRILDIGCGPGTTAVELARRVGPGGQVVGVDISGEMVAAAERRAERAGVTNVSFRMVDVQDGDLEPPFDGAYSRFGIMFFTDPARGFANIARALRPGGRLAAAVWSRLEDNPWMFVPTLAAAIALDAELSLPGPGQPGPFSLADPTHLTALLTDAGFVDVSVEPVPGPRRITTASADDEVRSLLEVGPLGDAYAGANDAAQEAAVAAVMGALEPYADPEGWSVPGVALRVVAAAG